MLTAITIRNEIYIAIPQQISWLCIIVCYCLSCDGPSSSLLRDNFQNFVELASRIVGQKPFRMRKTVVKKFFQFSLDYEGK